MGTAEVGPPELLTPAEVARMFAVDPKTVTRWADEGRISSVRTLGGHRRYPLAEVTALLSSPTKDARPSEASRTEVESGGGGAQRGGSRGE